MPAAAAKPRLAYLFSRYPVVSQTFCDSEMLALERMGFEIEVASLNRPPNSFRHERLDRLLLHLFQHQTHHRGQAHTILTGLKGRDFAPSFDLILYQRETGAGGVVGG